MAPIIQNFDDLATTDLRRDALTILEAGLAAIQVDRILADQITRQGNTLTIRDTELDLASYERVFLIGIGKCALDACQVLEPVLEDVLTDGIVLDVRGAPMSKLRSFSGSHPFPDEKNVVVTQSIADILDDATENDLVLTVVSGGGSALLCLPDDLSCEELTRITRELMHQGATIHELNTVRKHTSKIQGGHFAKLAYPARVVSLIFSDVPGDHIGTIASGPTVPDTSTVADAAEILTRYHILDTCEVPNCNLVETPKDPTYFTNVTNILVLNNEVALAAMQAQAATLGYLAAVIDAAHEGEARTVGAAIAAASTPGTCQLYGGETTVTVTNPDGIGGRNQELVLGALERLPEQTVVVAAASDGWDNGNVAGALGDATLATTAKESGLDPQKFLDENQSYDFFTQAGGHIITGRTGVNVSDLFFVLRGSQ